MKRNLHYLSIPLLIGLIVILTPSSPQADKALAALRHANPTLDPGCVPPDAGLISWWTGDGHSEDIVGAHHGALRGGVTFITGTVDTAFNLDGVDDFVSVAHVAVLNPITMTVEAWFYAADIAGQTYPPIVKKAGEGLTQDYGYALEINSEDGTAGFWVFVGGSWRHAASTAPIVPQTWYHVAGTYDGAEMRLYLNGQLQGAVTVGMPYEPSANPLYIGADPGNANRFFEGRIDEVSLYNRALSAAEIQALYAAGSAGKCKPVRPIHTQAYADLENILITWTVDESLTGVAGYHLFRKANAGDFVQLTTTPILDHEFNDADSLVPGANYCYQVKAVDSVGSVVAESNIACVQFEGRLRRAYLPNLTRNFCAGPIRDDFGNPASGWPVAETTYWSYSYLNSEYRMYAKESVFGAVSRGEQPTGQYAIEVDARHASVATGSLGLVFGLNSDWSELYTFEVYPSDQLWAIFHFSGGDWSIVGYGVSSAIQPGQASNRLRVSLTTGGSYMASFHVNGAFVTLVFPAYSSSDARRVGLTATSDAAGFDARFDNYKLVLENCPENPVVGAQQIGDMPTMSFESLRLLDWERR